MHDQALAAEDAAWLRMEDPTNPMAIDVLIELAARLDLELLRSLLARATADARFRSLVVEPAFPIGRPHWKEQPDFDLDRQIEQVTLEDASEEALRRFVGHAVSGCLARDLPLWRVFVITREGKGTTLLLRVHHAIADGFGLLGLLLSTNIAKAAVDVAPPKRARRLAGARGLTTSLVRVVGLPPDPPSPLKVELGLAKAVAWTRPIPLDEIKHIGARIHATVNDVVVGLVAGALRRYFDHREVDVEGLEVRAIVPVNRREPEQAHLLGNHFGLVLLPLPIGIVDPIARIAAASDRMRSLRGSGEPFVSELVLRAIGEAPHVLERAGVRFFGKKASLVLTNVPGPRRRIDLGGVPVSRLAFWVPQSGNMGLGVSVFSYANEVTVGFLAERAIGDPRMLAHELEEELTSLQRELDGSPCA